MLIADDEASIRVLIASILQRDDFQTLEAEDGVQALEIVRSFGARLNLVISDMRMPKMDGIALAQSIRAEFPTVPVMLISGFGFAAERCGHLEVIQKPFFPDELLSKVRQLASPRKPIVTAGEVSGTEPQRKSA